MGVLELLIGPVMQVVDKLIPDPQKKAEIQLELLKQQQAGSFKELDVMIELSKQQNDVNVIEAQSPSLFKSGWRPAAGWVCVAGLAYGVVQLLLPWIVSVVVLLTGLSLVIPPMPAFDTGSLLTLLLSLLGLGGLRSWEKKEGVASK